ncbi:MAG: Na+/H+ antiporter subunit E [Bacteroidetes bacterium]|jgi:multicomponent Na+:H+ antiporter subunit E|nr:Na+/H+ antiporter subunit E [Bacteroidota bacterium]
MKHLLENLFLAFIWLTLTMKFELVNFIFGFAAGFLVLWFVNRKKTDEYRYIHFMPRLLSFLLLFTKEVIKGSIRIGYDIVTPHHYMHPGIIAVPLDAKTDLEITLLANSITLTPGTTSIALSDDRAYLYVYNVYLEEDVQKSIDEIKNGLEKKLLEVLR